MYDEISQQWKGPASVEVQHSGFSSLQSLGQGGRMAKPVSYSGADVSKLWAKGLFFVNKVERSRAYSITNGLSVAAFALPWQRWAVVTDRLGPISLKH